MNICTVQIMTDLMAMNIAKREPDQIWLLPRRTWEENTYLLA